MDTKDLRGLMEAYSEVYAPQENIDEGLRSAVKRLLGGGKKEAEAPKPESRGEQLRKKYNVGPEKSDTSAKRQILNRSRARAERDQERYGDKPFQKQVAQQSKDAHDRYLKAGYSKYGADLKHGSGNKARKRAAALNREEFEFIVNALIEEGYDLSSYTWDEMYEICLDEASSRDEFTRAAIARSSGRKGGITFEPGPNWDPSANRGKGAHLSPKQKEKQRRKALRQEELDIFDAVLEFLQAEGFAETLEEAEWLMANVIDEEAIGIILGESALGTMAVLGGMAAGRAIHGKLQDRKAKKELEGKRRTSDYLTMKSRTKNAVFRDRRDSGDTRNEEYVDEAQHARENPEKYEREQAKKSAPVRGERTPMPPRGDKRREDFEKWYAKQMGR